MDWWKGRGLKGWKDGRMTGTWGDQWQQATILRNVKITCVCMCGISIWLLYLLMFFVLYFNWCACVCVITPTDVGFYSFKCAWDQMHGIFVCVYYMCVCVCKTRFTVLHVWKLLSATWQISLSATTKKEKVVSKSTVISFTAARVCLCVYVHMFNHTYLNHISCIP